MANATGPLGVHNVDDYGAAGNGSTDDSAAINAAVAAAGVGGTVTLSPGKTYALNANPISLNYDRITFVGTGATSIPTWSGTAGDVCWNTAVASGQPEGWRCLGGTSWTAMGNHT
jgi:hypothetical protein